VNIVAITLEDGVF